MRAVAFTMRDGETARLSACALSGTVVATVASPAYAVPMLRLAASSRAAGVPCLVVHPFIRTKEWHPSRRSPHRTCMWPSVFWPSMSTGPSSKYTPSRCQSFYYL